MAAVMDHADWRVTELVMRNWAEPCPAAGYGEESFAIEHLDHPALTSALPTLTG